MKFETLIEEIVAGILIGFVTYLCLMPPIHEGGHALIAHLSGFTVLEIQISIPAFVTHSFVRISYPINANLTFFYMAGSLSCLTFGFIISFIPIFVKNHWLFLSMGYALMSDALIYPLWSKWSGYGDWAEIDPILSVLIIGCFCLLLLISIRANQLFKGKGFLR